MTTNLEGKWLGSGDREMFDGPAGDTPDEAFSEWMAEHGDGERSCVAVGQLKSLLRFTGYARNVIDLMEERAGEEGHPDLDLDIIGVTKENVAELDGLFADVLRGWCQRHGVRFSSYGVENIIRCGPDGPVTEAKKIGGGE